MLCEEDNTIYYKGSCLQCRAAKTRCDHKAPCERCITMGLECVPQEKGRGRPKQQKATTVEGDEPNNNNSTTKKRQLPTSDNDKDGKKVCRDGAFASTMYYQSACLLMLSEFGRLQRSNGLDQLKVLCSMKSQAMRLARFGKEDFSKMMLDMQASLMGLSDWQSVMTQEDKSYADTYMHTDRAHCDDFLKAKGEIEAIIRPWDDPSMPQSYSVSIGGEPMTYCNDRYREMFLEDDSELEAFNAQKLYAPLLWGKTLCPEDHATFFSAVIQASCAVGAQASDCSMVVKCVKRDGKEFIGLVRFRSFFSATGVGYGFSILELPMSSPMIRPNPYIKKCPTTEDTAIIVDAEVIVDDVFRASDPLFPTAYFGIKDDKEEKEPATTLEWTDRFDEDELSVTSSITTTTTDCVMEEEVDALDVLIESCLQSEEGDWSMFPCLDKFMDFEVKQEEPITV